MNASELRKSLDRQKGECTWCGSQVGKGRRTWCSDECVDAYRSEHDWPYVRRKVFERDLGVCALCGTDCLKIKRVLNHTRRECFVAWKELTRHLKELGFDFHTYELWQADHILERVRGGGHSLDNLRTLCIPCHKIQTARLARERAEERKRGMEVRTSWRDGKVQMELFT